MTTTRFDLVTIDSPATDALAAFWSAAADLHEVEREDDDRWIVLADPSGKRCLGIQRGSVRAGSIHLDLACAPADFEADLARLNIRKPAHPKATEYVEAMIDWGKEIADKHCYELESGLYFDVSTVPEYGRLARAVTEGRSA